MAHLSTINADRSLHVTVVWIGLDGDDVVSGHRMRRVKVRNIERASRVVLSFDLPREAGVFSNPYAVLYAHATLEPSDDAWDLLNRLAKVYMAPDATFPAPSGTRLHVRYAIDRIGEVGPRGASA
jgi:PPOX class probable F420-dependent enzyme